MQHSMMERNLVLIDTDALYSSNIIGKYVVFDCVARVTHKYLTRDKQSSATKLCGSNTQARLT